MSIHDVICTISVFNVPDQKESEVQLLYGLCHNLYRNELLMAIIELYSISQLFYMRGLTSKLFYMWGFTSQLFYMRGLTFYSSICEDWHHNSSICEDWHFTLLYVRIDITTLLMSILSYRRVVICWQIISFIWRNCMFSMSVIFLVNPYFFVFPHQDSDEIDTIIEVINLYNICHRDSYRQPVFHTILCTIQL
jgi:hypothetical protein